MYCFFLNISHDRRSKRKQRSAISFRNARETNKTRHKNRPSIVIHRFLIYRLFAGDDRRRRLLCGVYRTVQTVRGGTDTAVPSRVPQELRRSLAAGAPDLSDVQDGHPQTLRVPSE